MSADITCPVCGEDCEWVYDESKRESQPVCPVCNWKHGNDVEAAENAKILKMVHEYVKRKLQLSLDYDNGKLTVSALLDGDEVASESVQILDPWEHAFLRSKTE